MLSLEGETRSRTYTIGRLGCVKSSLKKFQSIENQSQLPLGEEPAVSGASRRPSLNTPKVPPNDSSRRALQALIKYK